MKPPGELTELFRARGLKATPQRQAVFAALNGNPHHPTAEGVHTLVAAELPTVSLRTVYGVLHDLAAMGEVSEVHVGAGAVRFDPNLAHHHHLVCDGCGRVDDVDAPAATIDLPAHLGDEFEVTSTEIVLRGRCADCRAADDAQLPGSTPVDGLPGRQRPVAPDRPTSAGPASTPSPSRGDEHTHG